MTGTKPFPTSARVLVGMLLLCALGVGAWWYLRNRDEWPRGEALRVALLPMINETNTDQSLVAGIILGNYSEVRSNAVRWSGIYWSFTFAAAALSALAGLILKFERIIEDKEVKKDVAAVFAVVSALLITISSGGDFQRKWQANRIAAAELERTGYDLLEKNGAGARSYLATVGQILLRRQMSIVGGTEQGKPLTDTSKSVTPEN